MESLQVLILNHPPEAEERFSRHGAVIGFYQDGYERELVKELSDNWFSLVQACIVAHHRASLKDDGEKVNVLVAVNPFFQSFYKEFAKPKGKVVKYLFIFFGAKEEEARAFVYHALRFAIFENHPVAVDVSYHNVGFI